MSTRREIVAEFIRRASEHAYATAQVLMMWARDAWMFLGRNVEGQGFGGPDPGNQEPALILMVGGLTTLTVLIAWSMASRSLGSQPDPVNTRESRKKAQEAVDIHVEEPRSPPDPASSPREGPPATDDQSASDPHGEWGVTTSFAAQRGSGDGAAGSRASAAEAGAPRPTGPGPGPGQETLQAAKVKPVAEGEGGAAVEPASPSGMFQRGRLAGERVDVDDGADVFQQIEESGLGTPKIARDTPSLTVVRLQDCAGCRAGGDDVHDPAARAGCSFEAGFLEGSMSQVVEDGAVVREAACSQWGDHACEFEVWY